VGYALHTHQYVQDLTDAGVPEKQARIQAEALTKIIEESTNHIAEKRDLDELKTAITHQIETVNNKMDSLKVFLENKLEQQEARISNITDKLTIKFGGMLVVAVAVIGGLVKIIH